MAHSTPAPKAAKPSAKFPLFPHATGRWAKKIRGKLKYFGKVEGDPKGTAALAKYQEQATDLHAGRTPRAAGDGLTVRDLCNRFCSAKEDAANNGEITRRTFLDYHATAALVVGAFGADRFVDDLASDDFESLRASIAKRLNPNSLGNEVTRVRVLFKYGFDAGIMERPVRFGASFKRPAKRILRAHRQRKGPKLFEPRQLRRMLKAAPQPVQAMILLGLNCGFGNQDCGTLPLSAIDLRRAWINYPRPKTAVERRCPLWPETVAALKLAIAKRPNNEGDETRSLAFVTSRGQAWAKETADSPVSKEFRKLLDSLHLHRAGLGFYTLRHIFETIAGESRDQVAVDFIMGHESPGMAATYRESISDGRLQDAVAVVRRWLFRRSSAEPWLSVRPK